MNRIVNISCFHLDDDGRHWVLHPLDLMLNCSKSVFVHPLLVTLWWCMPCSHQEWVCVCNARRDYLLETRWSLSECDDTTVIDVVDVVRSIKAVSFQLWFSNFWMNTFVLLPHQESQALCSAGKHDQWPGYMTVLVVNHGIWKSFCLHNTVIHKRGKCVVDMQRNCSSQDWTWVVAIN